MERCMVIYFKIQVTCLNRAKVALKFLRIGRKENKFYCLNRAKVALKSIKRICTRMY